MVDFTYTNSSIDLVCLDGLHSYKWAYWLEFNNSGLLFDIVLSNNSASYLALY